MNNDTHGSDTELDPNKPLGNTEADAAFGYHHKADVASLTLKQLSAMSRRSLMAVLQAAALPRMASRASLAAMDLPFLQKLVLQARRACRQQGY